MAVTLVQVAQIPGCVITAEVDHVGASPETDLAARVIAIRSVNTRGTTVPYELVRSSPAAGTIEVLHTGRVPTTDTRLAIQTPKRPLWHGGFGLSLG